MIVNGTDYKSKLSSMHRCCLRRNLAGSSFSAGFGLQFAGGDGLGGDSRC